MTTCTQYRLLRVSYSDHSLGRRMKTGIKLWQERQRQYRIQVNPLSWETDPLTQTWLNVHMITVWLIKVIAKIQWTFLRRDFSVFSYNYITLYWVYTEKSEGAAKVASVRGAQELLHTLDRISSRWLQSRLTTGQSWAPLAGSASMTTYLRSKSCESVAREEVEKYERNNTKWG